MRLGTESVDAYLSRLDHPFKAEIELLRSIIRNADPKIVERVKWNRPGFYYQDNLAAFDLRERRFVELDLFLQRGMAVDDPTGLLEGSSQDRRTLRFADRADIEAKRDALERLVRNWVERKDELDGASFTASGRRRSGSRFQSWIPFAWIPLVLAGLTLVVQGLAATLRDDPFYRNYWGGNVYGPLAIALGALLLILIPYFEIRRRNRLGEAGRERGTRRLPKSGELR